MIKMVVSSFYNTLINQEDAIPTSTMLEIERIRQKKILFTICTNRQYQEVLDYNKDFPFVDYIISLNGSLVYDVEKAKIIYQKKLTKTIINKIIKFLPDLKYIYYSENEKYSSKEETEDKNIYKIELEISDNEEFVRDKLKNLPINITLFELNEKKYIEITSDQASMFSGVDKISLKKELDLANIITISGNESDISLSQNIKRNFVVKNASKKLKKYAYKIVKSNLENGVETVLSKIK